MGNGSIFAGIGVALIVVGLVYGYFSGVHMEHNVTALNFLASVVSYLEAIGIATAIVVIGGLMVIFGIKKS